MNKTKSFISIFSHNKSQLILNSFTSHCIKILCIKIYTLIDCTNDEIETILMLLLVTTARLSETLSSVLFWNVVVILTTSTLPRDENMYTQSRDYECRMFVSCLGNSSHQSYSENLLRLNCLSPVSVFVWKIDRKFTGFLHFTMWEILRHGSETVSFWISARLTQWHGLYLACISS